jgi:hypothetical protein
MIRYSLRCDAGHGFESWFASSAAFDALAGAGRLACPLCGSPRVSKSLMAPSVATERGEDAGAAPKAAAEPNADEIARRLARLRAEIEAMSEYVGLSFAAEARRIHEGTAPERPIYGEAAPQEARKLIEDGVPVAPLPFIPRRRSN